MQHGVHSLLLHEELVDVEGSAARVSQTETSHDVFLIDLPETWVVIDSLGRDAEEFSLWGQLNFWVGDNPLLLRSNLHEGKLLDVIILSIVDDESSSGTIN